MPKFGRSSISRLDTCDHKLQDICNEAIKIYDFSVVSGHRGLEEQNKLVRDGYSQLRYPQSKHNHAPSKAVDLAPYNAILRKIDWDDNESFYYLAGVIMTIAHSKGIKLEWGGTWHTFRDFPHWQLQI